MTHARSPRLVALAAPALAAAFALATSAGSARAGGFAVRVHGRAHVHVHAHFHAHARFHVHVGARPYYGYGYGYAGPRVHVRYYARPYVGYYWGIRFAQPPPPPSCDYECGAPVSAYYYQNPAPPQAAVVAAVPPAPEPALPTLGLGVFAGSSSVSGSDSGHDLGLVGRLRLSHHFLLEGELSKTELDSGARVDRRAGGALLWDLMPYSSLSPYLLIGAGVGRTDVNGGSDQTNQAYGEVGAGLEWRLTDHLSLIGDLRTGQLANQQKNSQTVALSTSGSGSVDQNENYTRARIGALLFF